MRPERRRPASLIAAAPARLREWGRFWTRREALPLVLLLLALVTVFLFGNDRGHFYRGGHHDWLTSQHLTQAVNLSPQHQFLLFVSHTLDVEGDAAYLTYARWPIGSYALVKVATLPFGDNFAAGIYAARIVMLLLFSGAAMLAYLALARLCGDGWVALTATLLAFSSYYCLYYNDAFAPDAVPGLFGALLAFHGMVIFEQEGRFRQLLIKSCAGLLLCWQAYALLLPFIVFALAREAFRARAAASAPPSLAGQIRRCAAALLSGRYLQLGVVTLCFGIAVLGFNVVNEYFAFDQERPLTQLPTLKRAAYRYSGEPGNSYPVSSGNYGAFLQQQFYRIGQMTQPYFMNPFDTNPFDSSEDYLPQDYLGLIAGALALAVGVVGLIFVRHKALLATGLLSGFVWTLPLRNWSAFHDFQALFYIGIPLAAFALIMLYIRRLSGPQLAAAFAVAALAVFVASAAEMADVRYNYYNPKRSKEMMQDFAVIRDLVNNTNGVVYVAARQAYHEPFGTSLASSYFLAGEVLLFAGSIFATPLTSQFPELRVWADYVVTPQREPGPALLTPDNRRVFLYDRAIYDGQYDAANLGSPIIAAEAWDVYFKYGSLIYISDQCANTDTAFFLHLLPRDISALPERSIEYGFENRDFFFADYDIDRRDARCIAVRELPEYEVAAISTGQYTDAGRLWQAEYHFE